MSRDKFKWDCRFLRLAREVADWSKDPSTKVGAIIVKDNKVVSLGFNGFAKGVKDDRYGNRDEKLNLIIHAEENAVLFADRKDLVGATLYTYPFMPCSKCAAKMIQVGISRVVSIESDLERWEDSFRLATEQFKEVGVDVDLFEDEDEVFQSHYCVDCGSCGEDGCCPSDMCHDVKNHICEMNLESYKELKEENERLREKLKNSIQKDIIRYNVVNPDMGNQIDNCNNKGPY